MLCWKARMIYSWPGTSGLRTSLGKSCPDYSCQFQSWLVVLKNNITIILNIPRIQTQSKSSYFRIYVIGYLPLGGSVKNMISTISAIYVRNGVNRTPHRQSPAAFATSDPTMYPSPLKKIYKTVCYIFYS